MSKTEIKFEKFCKAVLKLEKAYLTPALDDSLHVDGTIQRFEFTFELAWKFLKDYFSDMGTTLNFPKEIIQEAFAARLIDNEDVWVQMLSDRNMTSHAYDEKLANEIYQRIKQYVPEFKKITQLNLNIK